MIWIEMAVIITVFNWQSGYFWTNRGVEYALLWLLLCTRSSSAAAAAIRSIIGSARRSEQNQRAAAAVGRLRRRRMLPHVLSSLIATAWAVRDQSHFGRQAAVPKPLWRGVLHVELTAFSAICGHARSFLAGSIDEICA